MTTIAALDSQAKATGDSTGAQPAGQASKRGSPASPRAAEAAAIAPTSPSRPRPPALESLPETASTRTPLTAQDAWRHLRSSGLSAREWAERHGFEPSLVYSVLTGSRKCLRGRSFLVARALGMK